MTEPLNEQPVEEQKPVGAWIVVGVVVLAFIFFFTATLLVFLSHA